MKRIPALAVSALLLAGLTGCGTTATIDTAAPKEPAASASASTPKDDGTAKFGQTYTYEDGLSVTVSEAGKFRPSSTAFADGKGPFEKYTVKIVNKTGDTFDPTLISVSASSGDSEAGAVTDSAKKVGITPDTKIRDGRSVKYDVAFGTSKGDVTLEITPDFNHDSVLYGN